MVLLEDSSTASDYCDEDSAREYRKSGLASGYLTALFAPARSRPRAMVSCSSSLLPRAPRR